MTTFPISIEALKYVGTFLLGGGALKALAPILERTYQSALDITLTPNLVATGDVYVVTVDVALANRGRTKLQAKRRREDEVGLRGSEGEHPLQLHPRTTTREGQRKSRTGQLV